MNRLELIFLILIPFVVTQQTCDPKSYNSSCYSSSTKGVCCDYNNNYYCFLGYQKCCGYDGICKAGYDCCPGAYGQDSYCLIGYVCCNAGLQSLFFCDPGYECCGNKCCAKTFAGWAIAVIVIGSIIVIGAIGFCIYKRRKNRQHQQMLLQGGYGRDYY